MEIDVNRLMCDRKNIYTKVIPNSQLVGITLKIHLWENEKLGLPHLVEHLLTHQQYIPNYIKVEGKTNNNFIALNLMGHKDEFVSFITQFLYSIFNYKVAPEKFISEKAIVMQEMNHYKHSNLEQFATIARNIAFDSSDVNNDEILGNKEVIKSYSVMDVYSFLATHLVLQNMSIFISGCKEKVCEIKSIANNIKMGHTKTELGSTKITKLKQGFFSADKNNKFSKISVVYELLKDDLNKNNIEALSLLFSALSEGKLSLFEQLQKVISGLYFVQIIPIFKGKQVYLQIITSCDSDKNKAVLAQIRLILQKTSDVSESMLQNIFRDIKFHKELMFDGVYSGLNSFSNMPRIQESLINSSVDKENAIKTFKRIIRKLVRQEPNVVIV